MSHGGAIPLGFEVGTGEPVRIPHRNLAVTGQTQESGKTTTLEALVARSGGRAIAFVTKRGERAFAGGRRIPPYFRDRADWQFVDQLLEAQLREKNKFLRPWIIRICRSTKTLAEVQQAVRTALTKAKGINEGVYTQLDAYLELIVPEIGRAPMVPGIKLERGLNVMDVSEYSTPMQMLFVQSAIEWVNHHEAGVIVVVPEAWEFIPEGKGSPVKSAAVDLVRKGSALGNHIWIDSQDMAGVDKVILRGCPVWLIGVQREANEIKRNLANIPASIRRPRAGDVATLRRGEFFACWGEHTIKTYVQPTWLEPDVARAIARGESELPAPDRVNVATHARGVSGPLLGATSTPKEPAPGVFRDFIERGRAAQAAVDAILQEEDPSMCKEHARLELELEHEREVARAVLARAQTATRNAERRAAAADQLVDAIRLLLPSAGTGGADVDTIVEKVLARIPTTGGGPLQVTPAAKLRRDFQEAEVARILGAVREMDPLARKILKLLEGLEGRAIPQKQIAERLGRATGGGSWITLTTAVKEQLVGRAFAEIDQKAGVRARVRAKIAEDLSTYGASEGDVEAVYQNVLHAIATEGE